MAKETSMRPSGDRLENVEQRPTEIPRVDVYENGQELLLIADLPGVAKDNLGVRVDQDELVLEGRRAPKRQEAPAASEFRFVDFRRAFRLPQGIDREHIEAELKAGVLRLHLPKSASLRPRRIEVKSG